MLIVGSSYSGSKSTKFTHTHRHTQAQAHTDSALVPEQQRITRDYRMIRMFFLAGRTQNAHIKASWVHFSAMVKGVSFPVTNEMKREHTGHQT